MILRARGWQVGFPHSPLIAQITLGPVKFYFSLTEVYWFCDFCDFYAVA